uniref:RNA-binding protein n=1 Tax=Ustilago esculenta TaxID=185366 RepID=A0A481SG45_9BASI|nr:RNA-binding protein [Ustilago esculenta]
MTTKNQGPRHSLPAKPMVAPPTNDESTRDHGSLTDCCTLTGRDRQMEWNPLQWTNSSWPGHGWSTTPPFPTPALTASSLSSSSFYGEKSPVFAPTKAGQLARRSHDVPSMTSLPLARSFDDESSQPFPVNSHMGNGEQSFRPDPPCFGQYDGEIGSLSSSFSGLAMLDSQGQDSTRSMDSASYRNASTLTEPRPAAPLLIPMQPTGAGVPLTSVVETLSSKGSKAAAEDPETVAAAYKLSQWGIGIGPGINPKVASNHNGTPGRSRSTASEPPIVNTGNSGPMCVQPGDWICTSCGFVNSDVIPSNLLGIHISQTVMQRWEQQTERWGAMAAQSAGYGQDQAQHLEAQAQSQYSSQPYSNCDHYNGASSPYKVYSPQMSLTTNAQTTLGPVDYQPPELPQRSSDYTVRPMMDAGARMGLHRSATELHCPADYRTQHQQGSGGPSSTYSTAWSHATPGSASLLPKDIWAPAPKRPTLVPVDPEDLSREKRAKPQPIGTRSAATSGNTAASGKNIDLETAGRKDIDWISDSLTFSSAPAST